MKNGLSAVQRSAILGCSMQPYGMYKPRKVIVNALVKKGYAIVLRTGAIDLTEAGRHFAATGEETK